MFLNGVAVHSNLEDVLALSRCVETAVIGHLCSHSVADQARFSYWRNQREKEVDLILEMDDTIIPFEVKYQSQEVQTRDIHGLIDLCNQKPSIRHGYIITKDPRDIGRMQEKSQQKTYMKIPACFFAIGLEPQNLYKKISWCDVCFCEVFLVF